MQYITN